MNSKKQNSNTTLNPVTSTIVSITGQLMIGFLLITIILAIAVFIDPTLISLWVE
jgi:hypothetical protein